MKGPRRGAGGGRDRRRRAAQAEPLLRAALARHQQGDAAGAESLARQALALDDRAELGWHLLALVLDARGALEEALEAMQHAARLAPDDVAAHTNLGNLFQRAGAPLEAARAYRRALALRPDHATARFNLGKVLQQTGRAEEAVAVFRTLVEAAPEDAGAWDALGAALLDAGEADGAVAAHEHALALEPGSAEALNGLGLALLDLGRFEPACDCFRRALEQEPGFTKAALNLTRAKRFESAADPDLERLRRMAGMEGLPAEEAADLRFSLGKALDDTGAYDEAFGEYAAANALRARGERFDAEAHRAFVAALERVFTPALFERCAGFGLAERTPLLIVGMPRSGTTLVEQILASHPAVHGGGELGALPRLVAGLPARLGNQPYPDCAARLRRRDARQLAHGYVAALRERGGETPRVTDKMPANFLNLGILAVALPEATVVHCRRHPLDVVLSIFFHQFTQGYAYSWRLPDIVDYYRAYHRLMRHWQAVLPRPPVEVCHEALVNEPEERIRRLVAACGLDWDERCLSFHRTERPVHTASAWQVRQPINRAGLARWRHYERHLEWLRRELADLLPPGG